MNDPIEQEIQDKGLTAPRINPADLKANIVTSTISLLAMLHFLVTQSRAPTCQPTKA